MITLKNDLYFLKYFSKIVSHILSAKTSLDVCMYFFTLKQIEQAVISVSRQKVKVRVITDSESEGNEANVALLLRREGL